MRKWKNLVPLVVVLAILAALVVLKKTQDRPVDIRDQVMLTSLIPEDVAQADVTKLSLYVGSKADEKVELTRDATDPNVWRATSHFNAPVDAKKVEECIGKLVKLQGELREESSEEGLKDYNLSDDAAFHLLAYGKDAEKPAVELLVGKAPDASQVFVRKAGDMSVYVANVDFRKEAGIWGEEADKAPEADPWLDKKVVDVDQGKITKIALTTPDKNLVFEKREKTVEPEKKPEDAAQEGEGEEAAVEEPKAEYEWVLASGGPGVPHKEAGLTNLLNGFTTLAATSVVDPAKKAEWGLESPAFRCVLTVEGRDGDVVLEGGRPDPAGDGYIRVAGAKEEVVYKLGSWVFNKVFPNGTELFDLPRLALDGEKISEIELTQPEGRVVLVKDGATWKVSEPAANLDVATSAIDSMVEALAMVKASDYADSIEGTLLDAAPRKAVFTADGTKYTVEVGDKAKSFDGSYARVNGGPVLIMSAGDVAKVFVAPKDLYQRTLIGGNEEDVESVAITRGGEQAILTREDDGWAISVNGVEAKADQDPVEELVSALCGLQASDILFAKVAPEGQPLAVDGEPIATVSITTKTGEPRVLTIGANQDGEHQVTLTGKDKVFLADAADIEEILPATDVLRIPEAAQVESAPPAEQPESAPVDVAPAPVNVAPEAEQPAVAPAEAQPPEAAPAGE